MAHIIYISPFAFIFNFRLIALWGCLQRGWLYFHPISIFLARMNCCCNGSNDLRALLQSRHVNLNGVFTGNQKMLCRFMEENKGTFTCTDTAYILSFSLMMLNTDLYNRSLKCSQKMTLEQFIKNNKGIDQQNDLPR